MLSCRPSSRESVKNIKLKADIFLIDPSDKVKILGKYYTSGLSNEPNVKQIVQKVSYRLNILSKIVKYTNKKTSLILFNSLIISVFSYCLEDMMDVC